MGSGSVESADKIEENRATGACLDILSPPKPSSTSTPPTAAACAIGGTGNETSDSFNPFEKDSLDESASVLSSKQLLAEGQGSNVLPSELVDINLAISALNLDFDGQKHGQTTATTEPADVLKDGAEPSATGSDDHPPPALYPPGMIPQHMPFFPLNEFGQPMHAPFPGDHPHSPIPWDSKPGQTPFGLMGSQSPNMDGLRSQMVPPGMVPMVPPGNFDFHGDGLSGGPPITDPSQLFGMKGLKDGQLSANFPVMEHMGFNAPQQHVKNNPMWPPINGRDEQQFNGVQLPPNGLVHNNMHHDRRYPYYQPRNNHRHNNNGFNNRNHPNRKPNRYRGEDASKFENAKLADFIGQIYSLCKDQHGCRFLQRQLDLDHSNATAIFEETQMAVVELMMDPFGNYLIQKLLEKVNNEERLILIRNASPSFVTIALNPHGTRALQKLVELLNSKEEAKLVVEALSSDVVLLARDLNGNHVIQKCLQVLDPPDSQFIFDAASAHCLEIATHRHGCCVLQRCIDHGSKENRSELCSIISKYTVELARDAYGNYVVQYVLERDENDAIKTIVNAVKGDLISLSLHKFGSNVIEKCLKCTPYAEDIINELLNNNDQLVKLLHDSYGNYVLQTALNVSKATQLEKLSDALIPLIPEMRNTPHAKKILHKLNPHARTISQKNPSVDDSGDLTKSSPSPTIIET